MSSNRKQSLSWFTSLLASRSVLTLGRLVFSFTRCWNTSRLQWSPKNSSRMRSFPEKRASQAWNTFSLTATLLRTLSLLAMILLKMSNLRGAGRSCTASCSWSGLQAISKSLASFLVTRVRNWRGRCRNSPPISFLSIQTGLIMGVRSLLPGRNGLNSISPKVTRLDFLKRVYSLN